MNNLFWVLFKKLLTLKFLPDNSDLKIYQFLKYINVPLWKGIYFDAFNTLLVPHEA